MKTSKTVSYTHLDVYKRQGQLSEDPEVSFAETGLLRGLTSLRLLNLTRTPVAELGPLMGLTRLQSLELVGTEVRDITQLAGLVRLQSLNLAATLVTNFCLLYTSRCV